MIKHYLYLFVKVFSFQPSTAPVSVTFIHISCNEIEANRVAAANNMEGDQVYEGHAFLADLGGDWLEPFSTPCLKVQEGGQEPMSMLALSDPLMSCWY